MHRGFFLLGGGCFVLQERKEKPHKKKNKFPHQKAYKGNGKSHHIGEKPKMPSAFVFHLPLLVLATGHVFFQTAQIVMPSGIPAEWGIPAVKIKDGLGSLPPWHYRIQLPPTLCPIVRQGDCSLTSNRVNMVKSKTSAFILQQDAMQRGRLVQRGLKHSK